MPLDIQLDAAMKAHASSLLAELNISRLDDLDIRAMGDDDRKEVRSKLRAFSRRLPNKITDKTDEARAAQIEAVYDAVSDTIDQIDLMESRSRRPIGSDVAASAVDDGYGEGRGEVAYALKPQERMATWAQAREPNPYRGLTTGAYLRSMIVGAKNDVERRALAEGTDSAGGYTVPTALSATLIDLLRASSVLSAAGARTVPLTSDTNVVAALASDPVPAWRAENAAVNESDPTFRGITMIPRSLAVMTKISRELLEDSLNLEQTLPGILATALATELDRVGLIGSGTAPEPRGIANTVGIGTNAVNGVATYAKMGLARTGILTANAGPLSAYIMHPRDEGYLVGLTDTNGQPLQAPKVISDIPWLTTTAIPTNGGTGTDESRIFAGNFAHMLIGIRSQIRVEVLRERYADYLQYGFIAHMRADIAVEHPGAFYTLTGIQPS